MTVMHGQDFGLLNAAEGSRLEAARPVGRDGTSSAPGRFSLSNLLSRLRLFLPGITTPRKSRAALAEGYEVMARRSAARGLEMEAGLHREAAMALRRQGGEARRDRCTFPAGRRRPPLHAPRSDCSASTP